MKRYLALILFTILCASGPVSGILSKQRAVPVNSSTAVFVGRGVTVGGEELR
jgi:hypothetical protein